ncbi:MAG: DUF2232 domain-containing protein [Rhizobiaceae bacterium]
MKPNPTLIAILCGLLAAVLFLGQITLGVMGSILSTFTAFPLFVSVLGFGTTAGLISGAVAALIVGIMFGPWGALVIALLTLGPTLWVGHMAGLARDEDGEAEWFPISTILVRMAAISAVITIVMGYASGFTTEMAVEQINTYITQFIGAQSKAAQTAPMLSADQITTQANSMARIIPIAFPASIFLLLVINLLLGERFARKQGWVLRPKDDLPTAVGLPLIAVSVFIASIAAAIFITGPAGLVAKVVAGAFGAAFIVVGLATTHYMTRGLPGRGFMLGLTYAALLFTRIIAPILAVLGVAETLFQLRSRYAAGRNSTH